MRREESPSNKKMKTQQSSLKKSSACAADSSKRVVDRFGDPNSATGTKNADLAAFLNYLGGPTKSSDDLFLREDAVAHVVLTEAMSKLFASHKQRSVAYDRLLRDHRKAKSEAQSALLSAEESRSRFLDASQELKAAKAENQLLEGLVADKDIQLVEKGKQTQKLEEKLVSFRNEVAKLKSTIEVARWGEGLLVFEVASLDPFVEFGTYWGKIIRVTMCEEISAIHPEWDLSFLGPLEVTGVEGDEEDDGEEGKRGESPPQLMAKTKVRLTTKAKVWEKGILQLLDCVSKPSSTDDVM